MQKYSRTDAHNTTKYKHITDMVLPGQPFESRSLVLVDDHNLNLKVPGVHPHIFWFTSSENASTSSTFKKTFP